MATKDALRCLNNQKFASKTAQLQTFGYAVKKIYAVAIKIRGDILKFLFSLTALLCNLKICYLSALFSGAKIILK